MTDIPPTPNLLGQGTWVPTRCPLCDGRTFSVDLNDLSWDECTRCGACDFGDGWEETKDGPLRLPTPTPKGDPDAEDG